MISDELEKTLQRAMDKAIKCEHQFITLEHLLYALIEDLDAKKTFSYNSNTIFFRYKICLGDCFNCIFS